MRQVKSRTQRRMERKQAMVLLALVLAVSLVSFTLGVMVGRGGPERTAQPSAATRRMPVSQLPTQPPASAAPAAAPAAAPEAKVNLTFFDTLPKGEEPPLGSGINLPPQEEGEKPAAEKPETSTGPPPASQPSRPSPASPPPAAAEGSYLVQTASFRSAEDALTLQKRLAQKGYAAFVQSADLGEKGVWTRVFIGPFPSKEEAQAVVRRLQKEERLSGLVKKR